MKNEERDGASIASILHKHPCIILYNKGVYLMWC